MTMRNKVSIAAKLPMATILIDQKLDYTPVTHRTMDYGRVEDALLQWDALTRQWSESGWTKQHECWVRDEEWQQRVLLVGETMFVEGDSDDE